MQVYSVNKTVYSFTEDDILTLLRKTYDLPNHGQVHITSDMTRLAYSRHGRLSPNLITIIIEK